VILVAFVFGATICRFSRLVAGVVFKFTFVAVAEEFLFRGYVQTRLNMAFGRPFQLFGIHYGLGLILASIVFGLFHPLACNAPRPWPWALWTAAGGMTLGMLREKSGSIVAPAIAHGIFVLPTAFMSGG
jgi:membrane protease YdiL (CAAX protease family)